MFYDIQIPDDMLLLIHYLEGIYPDQILYLVLFMKNATNDICSQIP